MNDIELLVTFYYNSNFLKLAGDRQTDMTTYRAAFVAKNCLNRQKKYFVLKHMDTTCFYLRFYYFVNLKQNGFWLKSLRVILPSIINKFCGFLYSNTCRIIY